MSRKLFIKRFAVPNYWTCARCGTTNTKNYMKCTECGNRRPW